MTKKKLITKQDLTEADLERLEEYKKMVLDNAIRTDKIKFPKVFKYTQKIYANYLNNSNVSSYKTFPSPTACENFLNPLENDNYECYYVTYAQWTPYYVYYKFLVEIIEANGIELEEDLKRELNDILDFTTNIHQVYLYKYPVFSQRPIRCSYTKERSWHNDNEKALEYEDGTGFYALNGVKVDPWVVTTPAEKIDPLDVLKMDNVEARTQAVKKVGVERILYKLGSKPIEKSDDGMYELHKIKIDNENHKYLKMANPSVPEIWHVEGVPPNINSIQAALNFRNGFTEDQIDDENGVDWYQQGDVLLKPKGAKKFKSRPKELS